LIFISSLLTTVASYFPVGCRNGDGGADTLIPFQTKKGPEKPVSPGGSLLFGDRLLVLRVSVGNLSKNIVFPSRRNRTFLCTV
jgi:hypothetical protein